MLSPLVARGWLELQLEALVGTPVSPTRSDILGAPERGDQISARWHRGQALQWLHGAGGPLSLRRVCSALDLSPAAVRREALAALRARRVESSSSRRYQGAGSRPAKARFVPR